MISYQIAVGYVIFSMILAVLITGFVEELIKRHKEKKQEQADIIRENKQLKRKIQAIKLMAELKGVDLGV